MDNPQEKLVLISEIIKLKENKKIGEFAPSIKKKYPYGDAYDSLSEKSNIYLKHLYTIISKST